MLLPIVRRDAMVGDSLCIETARRGEDDAVVTMAALAALPRAGASLAAYVPPVRGRRSVEAEARGRRRRPAEVSR
jgi:hypothetical protein